jgi:hypothetical protein
VTVDSTFLGLIALATTVMAVLQVGAAIYAVRAARDATQAARELRSELAPILANARRATDDAARITALALTQVERVDQFVTTTTEQVTESLSALRDAVVGPVRQGTALWAGLKAALSFFAERSERRRVDDEDEDENLFIG